jgi:superfamily I DNA/RNA helicase
MPSAKTKHVTMTADDWNDEQRAFLDAPFVSGTLLGIPGGGKTRTLLGRVIRLIERGHIERTGFIVVTFSRAACADFLRKGEEGSSTLEMSVRSTH